MTETTARNRISGGGALLVSIVGIVMAFVVQPFAEWGPFGYVLGACVLGLGLVGAWTLVSGRDQVLRYDTSPARRRTIALIGLAASAIVIITNVVQDWDHWTAADVLVIAVWFSLGITYITTIWMVRNQE